VTLYDQLKAFFYIVNGNEAVMHEFPFMVSIIMTSRIFSLHCKKRLAIFPSPTGMSLIKLSLAGNNYIIPAQGQYLPFVHVLHFFKTCLSA
jgi:hypothetical protein